MDLFLTSNNREIVRSVLGFIKVCVISLPNELMLSRLESLIPNLIVWSHEHKSHFKAKVKHILERMIRRFGVDVVEKWCPTGDRKLITNIRKTRERRKRKKEGGLDDGEDKASSKPKGRFESEFDEAIYGSDSDVSSDISDDEALGHAELRRKARRGGDAFIVEDEDEPLDLLDRRALANISSTKPLKPRTPGFRKTKAKTNQEGKLVFGEGDDDDAMILDIEKDRGQPTGDGGVGAYVEALRGKDAVQRGQRGKLKFSNRRTREEDDMDVDEDDVVRLKTKVKAKSGQGAGGGIRGGFQVKARGDSRPANRIKAGRVMKASARGRRGGRRPLR
jgi:ribosomal RNA-processing protein 12